MGNNRSKSVAVSGNAYSTYQWRNQPAAVEAAKVVKFLGLPTTANVDTYGFFSWANPPELGPCVIDVVVNDSKPVSVQITMLFTVDNTDYLEELYQHLPCTYALSTAANPNPQLSCNWTNLRDTVVILVGVVNLIKNNTPIDKTTLARILKGDYNTALNTLKNLCKPKQEWMESSPDMLPETPQMKKVTIDNYLDAIKDLNLKPTDPRFVNNTAEIYFRDQSDPQVPIPYKGTGNTDGLPQIKNHLKKYGKLRI